MCLKIKKHNLKFEKIQKKKVTVSLLFSLKKLYSGILKKMEITSNQSDVKACRYFQRHDKAKSPDEIPGNDRISGCVGQFFVSARLLGVSNLS